MTAHTVTLVFEDGRTVRVPADEADPVYLAALRQKVRLLTDCLEGACATCKGICTSGNYRLDDYSEEALSAEEAARREVLTCQMHALSDCVVEMPYAARMALRGPPEGRAGRVAVVETPAESVARVVVELPEPLSFLPGQYVHLEVPGTGALRSYSFANPPREGRRLEFFVKLLAEGAMSEYARERAAPGDEVSVIGPFGHFYLRAPTRPLLMVAGGTGLAPMLSMLDHLADEGGCGQPIRLLYGANTPGELFAGDRLARLAAALPLAVERAAVAPAPGWDGAAGFVTDLLRPALLEGGDCDAYLCGPPAMIEAAETWLAANGLPPGAIHAEKFLPS